MESNLEKLHRSQQEIVRLLNQARDHQDWSPADDRWSFREIAAHLAATERECFLPRVKQFRTEEQPRFSYYHNTGRDFSGHDIQDSLAEWKRSRQSVMENARSLEGNQLHKEALHETMGKMDLGGLLELILSHDKEHLQEIQENLAALGSE